MGGEGESEASGGVLKVSGGGGLPGGRGPQGAGGCLREIWRRGVGQFFFFFGAEIPTKKLGWFKLGCLKNTRLCF